MEKLREEKAGSLVRFGTPSSHPVSDVSAMAIKLMESFYK
jgi:hypothetical protein